MATTETMNERAPAAATALTADDWWICGPGHPVNPSDSRRGASALVQRCVRTYGWTDDHALAVLKGYRKFLGLKKALSDWKSKILSPSVDVDKMWHMHILDTENYEIDCVLLFGRMVHHDPDGMLDEDAKRQRVETTRSILIGQLGEDETLDEGVWDFGHGFERRAKRARISESDEEKEDGTVSAAQGVEIEAPNRGGSGVSGELTVNFLDLTSCKSNTDGKKTYFKVKAKTKIGKITAAFAQRKQIEEHRLRFLFDGERICKDQTPEWLEMKDGNQIQVYMEQVAC